jgi:hypothetical protein
MSICCLLIKRLMRRNFARRLNIPRVVYLEALLYTHNDWAMKRSPTCLDDNGQTDTSQLCDELAGGIFRIVEPSHDDENGAARASCIATRTAIHGTRLVLGAGMIQHMHSLETVGLRGLHWSGERGTERDDMPPGLSRKG